MPEPGRSSTPASDRPTRRPALRWWPALLILALAALGMFYFRVVREDSQQWRNVYALETCIVAVVLLVFWVLFLSRLRWKVRWLVIGSGVASIGLMAALFRIHGVTGDLVLIL